MVFPYRCYNSIKITLPYAEEFLQLASARYHIRWKRAVQASRKAERNPRINTNGTFIRLREEWTLQNSYIRYARRSLATDEIVAFKPPYDLIMTESHIYQAMYNLSRPDTMHDPPWSGLFFHLLAEYAIKVMLHQAMYTCSEPFIRPCTALSYISFFIAIKAFKDNLRYDSSAL